jgi:hypothetical protein
MGSEGSADADAAAISATAGAATQQVNAVRNLRMSTLIAVASQCYSRDRWYLWVNPHS